MHRKFIALILGASIAVTSAGIAAPAHADNGDLAKFLAGFAALAILGKAIEDSRDRADVVTSHGHGHGNRDHIRRRHSGRDVRPLPRNVSRFDLPRGCLINFDVPGRRDVQLYGARCLHNRYAHAGSLPRQCRARFKAGGATRDTYKPGCLHQHGYRLARQ